MKRDFDYQYKQWQQMINNRSYISNGFKTECRRVKDLFDNDIKAHRERLDFALQDSSQLEVNKQEFELLIKELKQFQVELNVNYGNIREYIEIRPAEILRRQAVRQQNFQQIQQYLRTHQDLNNEEQQGLTAQRLQQFEQFQADDSFVGDQCVICMGDIEINRNMIRLDCDGKHTFCQVCIEGWFAIKKTCPICRHVF